MVSLPAGKNRILTGEDSSPSRLVIGRGEEAVIYRVLEGDFEGLVCRTPHSKKISLAGRVSGWSPEQDMLDRFRNLQIGHAMFPQNVIEARALNLDTGEIFSTEVERSKQNLRDCTRVGLNRRSDRASLPLEGVALEVAQSLERDGIKVEPHLPNVSVVDGVPTFFEIIGLDANRVRAWCDREQNPAATRVRTLLEIQQFEMSSDGTDLFFAFEDPEQRLKLLEAAGVGHLDSYYDDALGSQIITAAGN